MDKKALFKFKVGALIFLTIILIIILILPGRAGLLDTGFKFPTTNGDDYTAWTNPANTYADDGNYANEITNEDSHDWYDFNLGVPTGVNITGIEIEIESYDSMCTPNGALLEISWDGGASYTTSGQNFAGGCFTWDTSNHGNSSYLWGRTWQNI